MAFWDLLRSDDEPGRGGKTAHPLSRVHREIDRMFSDFFRDDFPDLPAWPAAAFPRVNVSDRGEGVKVTAEMPGMHEKDIHVTLQDDALVIEGEKLDEKEEEVSGWFRRERTSGKFRRSVPLPSGLDLDKAAALFVNGVLTIDVPRRPEALPKARKLEVKAG